jgi:hypothetical protein
VALEVVVGARGECELVLATVAGARVDVTHSETAPARGGEKVEVVAEAAEVSEEGQHQRSTQA